MGSEMCIRDSDSKAARLGHVDHTATYVYSTDRVRLLALLFYACTYVTAAVDKATTDFLVMTGVISLMCALTSANRMTSWL